MEREGEEVGREGVCESENRILPCRLGRPLHCKGCIAENPRMRIAEK